MEQAKQLMAAAEAASDHITLLRNTLMEMRATWANQVGADPSEWEQEFPRLAERVRAALGEQPGSPIEMPDEDGDDLPGYEFRVKDPDFLSEMVESAGLSTAAYLEYGEYATFHITIHPDASISGFICRQDGGNDDEVAEMTEDERAESEED